MRECADCPDPPGGRTCCDGGLTPMCYIEEGKTVGVCLDIPQSVSESPDQLVQAIVDAIVDLAGEDYRDDAGRNVTFYNGILYYESTDRRIRASAKQVLAERGSPTDLAPL